MRIEDLFFKEGAAIALEGKSPLLLDDPEAVWMTGPEKIAIFLALLDQEHLPCARAFLFDADPGELLFGMTSVDGENKMALLAAGTSGSIAYRMDVKRFSRTRGSEQAGEAVCLTDLWLNRLAKAGRARSMDFVHFSDDGTDGVDAFPPAVLPDPEAYLMEAPLRESIHSALFRSLAAQYHHQKEAEAIRLQKKRDSGRSMIDNAVLKLAAVHQAGKQDGFFDQSASPLLDACRLVGRYMGIEIVLPPIADDHGGTLGPTLDAIARASRIRTREVALTGAWYSQDSGPILGFLKEDERPVALLPSSPGAYRMHDPNRNRVVQVDGKTAKEVKPWGVVLFRSFGHKKIMLRDLLSFGLASCWKRDLFFILFMGVLGGLLSTAVPLATGVLFDSILPEGDRGGLLQIACVLGASALAAMLFQLTRTFASMRMEGKMDGAMQAAVWDRLLSLPVPFFKQFSAGELAMRAMGISQIRKILSGTTLSTILSGIFSVFTFVLLFYYDARLAGVAALMVAFAVLVMGYLGFRKVAWERKTLECSNRLSGLIMQLIGGISKFRVAGAENMAFARWAQEFQKQRRMALFRDMTANCLTVFNAVFPALSSLVLFYALMSRAFPLQAGRFIGFYSAFTTFLLSMVSLADALIGANLVIPLYQKARPILEALPEDDDTKVDPKEVTGAIEVSHVSFRYQENGPLVLDDVSFRIEEGDYVALVGTSGCGKSTLLRILLGFEKPEIGNVLYNGQDLLKADVRSVRRQLGVVLQNGQLMTGNILSNIIGANPRLTIDDAWEAAKMAGLEEDIRDMPMGMFTVISEGAGTISGGQKQRLMIARAIVNKPKVIFFDEATSALDNRTQSVVSASLDSLQATRIIIAHRLSTVNRCNKILVMDQGRIVESGTYLELLEKGGIFAVLAKRQLT